MNKFIIILSSSLALTSVIAHADQQIQDDLVVGGSICTGLDCVNGEPFGFDTIRLKENNVRIKFIDTSSSSSFPTGDWEIEINDSANGGSNHFAIKNVDTSTTPFSIIQGAPSNSLYVAPNGNIGFGTTAPLVDVDIKGGNTPTVRLSQDASSGFAVQEWDMGGNEANFFIRDVTNGSALPFRIMPHAPNGSIHIAANGDIGLETTTPDGLLDVAHSANANNHALLIDPNSNVGINIDNGQLINGLLEVQTTGGVSRFIVSSAGQVGIGTNSPTALLSMSNAGTADIQLTNEATATAGKTAQIWTIKNTGKFIIGATGTALTNHFILDANGNLKIKGLLNQGSDVNNKENIKVINGQDILNRLSGLPITTWNYKNDSPNNRHLGPMAQDFYSQFNLGNTDKSIASLDTSGVALISIQQLNKNILAKEKTIKSLQQRLEKLENLVERLSLHTQKNKLVSLNDTVVNYN